ncbi:MAG: hypothetical protein IKR11_07000 [Solobacterium sp.]|nr:hypothetical protein [Solobacterium sp.]
MSDNTEKVLNALSENPGLLEQLLNAKKEAPTRALPGQDPTSLFLKKILGDDSDVSAASEALENNGLMQLYLGADGDIDAKELMDYVGGFSGTKANNNPSVKGLLDGKLDFKEILMLLALMKLMKGGKKPAQSSGLGLLGSLLGGSNQQSQSNNSALNLFSSMLNAQANQPVQQPQTTSLFGNLFGTQAQPQVQQPQSNSLLGSLLGTQPQPQVQQTQQNAAPVYSLNGNTVGTQSNNGMDVLQSLLNGNTGVTQNNPQAQQLYSLLNGNSANSFNSNGSVNVGTLFNLANQLLGGK